MLHAVYLSSSRFSADGSVVYVEMARFSLTLHEESGDNLSGGQYSDLRQWMNHLPSKFWAQTWKENDMPIINTQSDTIMDAEELLAAVAANPDLLPNLEEYRAPLDLVLGRIKSLRVTQKTLTADKQMATQQLKAAYREARDLTIQLRGVVRAKIGVRSEKLVEFNVPPLRPRPRKSKPAGPVEESKKPAV
jgi:hypothetical protein